ncbi:hypothetical protein [Risungbinella massiliensis]|uniref:hypothetical protein n=1 Tax=Risungbinella massiliensis TaxID=1329796 RepID=UPI0005CBDB2C|nr:hypothetical protein [Risungbinella massiliensis]
MNSVENLVKLISHSVRENLYEDFSILHQRLDRLQVEVRSVRVEMKELLRRLDSLEQDMGFTKQAVIELRYELHKKEGVRT